MRRAVRVIVVKDDALLAMHRNKFGHEYYTLIGGGVDADESLEEALLREVMEETTLTIDNLRLAFVEDGGPLYGDQYIYRADYVSGNVALHSQAEEALINKLGQNLYTPLWLPLAKLPDVTFLSETLKQHIIHSISKGWPAQPLHFKHIENVI